ncbi:membrane lipoprotein lipid attachment site-containing protein [Sporosarcina sp. Marseille-Q4063]|uniref:membrane lipoprotein lipid attachment site-containing protein n=1 Tax=Sporosarcina sp. Marseille-Q4063 TaxID=2810514 RepID=UPI001BAE886E|nr:membrane lipoprotein lipid attachment site-containing protein [Sporosarcina sp. Marseille-Q4063]QUW23562.1 membrane lipoprotein lipid attachment site-containing protein [Sporosarcina sp. Marseille-Q4063]
MKRFILILLAILVMSGCSAKSAQQHGHGISVEMADSLHINHMTLNMFVNGNEVFSENVINADNSSFKKGEIIWFDVSPRATNSTVELTLSYSRNLNGTNAKTTEKIDISNANDWVTIKFTKNYDLHLIKMQ